VGNPSLYWRTNVSGTRALLDAMVEHRVPTLVFSSTAATYGEPEIVPITEDAPTRPTNTYGATKLAVDMMITGETVATGLSAVSLRYFNVAGAALGARSPAPRNHSPSSATTGPPRTAPRSATTCTCSTWPTPTCSH
jgi:UDP-glucose 4-epimerase